MLAVAFLAPSFTMVYVIYATNIVFQIIAYIFAWQNIVDMEDHPDLMEEILNWWFGFFLLGKAFFILIQKREL